MLDWVNRISSMSRDELLEEGNRLIAHAQALDNKEKSGKAWSVSLCLLERS